MATEAIKLFPINEETCFVPGTDKGSGRRISVAPGKTAARFLNYGRITIGAVKLPTFPKQRSRNRLNLPKRPG
jgi:hypothetical protein